MIHSADREEKKECADEDECDKKQEECENDNDMSDGEQREDQLDELCEQISHVPVDQEEDLEEICKQLSLIQSATKEQARELVNEIFGQRGYRMTIDKSEKDLLQFKCSHDGYHVSKISATDRALTRPSSKTGCPAKIRLTFQNESDNPVWLASLCGKAQNVYKLIHKWYGQRHKYWRSYTKDLTNFGSVASQAGESMNASLKKDQQFMTLPILLKTMLRVTKSHKYEQIESVERQVNSTVALSDDAERDRLEYALRLEYTQYAVDQVLDQIDSARRSKYLFTPDPTSEQRWITKDSKSKQLTIDLSQDNSPCTCSYKTQFLIPCRHVLGCVAAHVPHELIDVIRKWTAPRWLISTLTRAYQALNVRSPVQPRVGDAPTAEAHVPNTRQMRWIETSVLFANLRQIVIEDDSKWEEIIPVIRSFIERAQSEKASFVEQRMSRENEEKSVEAGQSTSFMTASSDSLSEFSLPEGRIVDLPKMHNGSGKINAMRTKKRMKDPLALSQAMSDKAQVLSLDRTEISSTNIAEADSTEHKRLKTTNEIKVRAKRESCKACGGTDHRIRSSTLCLNKNNDPNFVRFAAL